MVVLATVERVAGCDVLGEQSGDEIGFSVLEALADDGRGEIAPTGLAASPPLRSNPRATRRVLLACSTLIGLVNTRFAPMRKAFATPDCPSTTATASEAWFEVELRALLNSRLAFCSLSQSTTIASKCWPINFLTATKGSAQASTLNSNSVRTWVVTRAVFSSGQKSSA